MHPGTFTYSASRTGERNADVLGLRAVDHVAEEPAARAEALAEASFAAEPALPQAETQDMKTRSPTGGVFTPNPAR